MSRSSSTGRAPPSHVLLGLRNIPILPVLDLPQFQLRNSWTISEAHQRASRQLQSKRNVPQGTPSSLREAPRLSVRLELSWCSLACLKNGRPSLEAGREHQVFVFQTATRSELFWIATAPIRIRPCEMFLG
eukprot:gene17637-biopygen5070